MVTSQNGILFIRKNEGVRLSVYNDNGHPAIGYGHDLTQHEIVSGVYVNGITVEQAAALLQADLMARYEPTVNEIAPQANQNQYDSLIDFCYNLGGGALKKMLAHGWGQVPVQIPRWNHVNGVTSPGLTARREAEVELFNTPV
jgi:lysozyme